MCKRAWMQRGEDYEWASNRGELRALLGVEPLFSELPEPADDDCLCCCDLTQTAALAGYTVKPDDYGDVELTPNKSSPTLASSVHKD